MYQNLGNLLIHSEELSISENVFHSAAEGYGWKWVSPNEIIEGTELSRKSFYDMIGLSPSHFYFDANTFTTFCYRDYVPNACFYDRAYHFEQSAVWSYNMAGEKYRVMRVLTINESKLVCIELLGNKNVGGTMRKVYGLSVYSRMTEKELSKIRSLSKHETQSVRRFEPGGFADCYRPRIYHFSFRVRLC